MDHTDVTCSPCSRTCTTCAGTEPCIHIINIPAGSHNGAPAPKRIRWADQEEGSSRPLEEIYWIPRQKRRLPPQQLHKIRLLATAFGTFASFAILQMAVAVLAQSQSLIGDSAIMIVDSLTYLCNYVAEVRKGRYEQASNLEDRMASLRRNNSSNQQSLSPEERKAIRDRTKRKIVLQMEIFPPVISMASLLVVIGFLFNKSIRIIRNELRIKHSNQEEDHNDDPNVQIMLGFAFFNMLLDILNFTCFARSRHDLLGTTSSNSSMREGREKVGRKSAKTQGNSSLQEPHEQARDEKREESCTDIESAAPEQPQSSLRKRTHHHSTTEPSNTPANDDDAKKEQAPTNLNMCSAFAHISADMLRSIAVIVAATVANCAPTVSPEIADGSAALVVYCLVLVSIYPVVRGLFQVVPEYRTILAQERAEQQQQANTTKSASEEQAAASDDKDAASSTSIIVSSA